jgi:hypothetical protein
VIAIASFLFLGMSYGFSVAAQHEAAALHDLSFLFPVQGSGTIIVRID